MDDGVAGATRSGTRHLVGPVILPPTTLVVAATVLLVTPARGGVFTIRRALHAAPCTGPKDPKDLDGEKATLHQLKMESEPLRQAVDMSKRLPSPTKIHHVRGGEVDADPRATDPAAPHVQPQRLRRIQLHLPRKWSRETKATARRPTQLDEELTRVIPNTTLHWRRSCWRRRGRRVVPSYSSPSAPASPTASPPSPSPRGWLCHRRRRKDALSSGDPRRHC